LPRHIATDRCAALEETDLQLNRIKKS